MLYNKMHVILRNSKNFWNKIFPSLYERALKETTDIYGQ